MNPIQKITPILVMLLFLSILAGCIDDSSIDTENQHPTAEAVAYPTEGTSPLTVNLIGAGSDTDGYIAAYHWEFNDPAQNDQSFKQQNLTYTFIYGGSGYYPNTTIEITLTVTDNHGATDVDTVNITIWGAGYSVRPESDTYVDSSSPDENYGTREYVIASKTTTNESSICYLLFNLVDLPQNGSVEKATLHLQVNNIDSPTDIGVYSCSNISWNETLMTWNTAPPYEDKITSRQIDDTKNYSWDVTSAIYDAFLIGKVTLVIKVENTEGFYRVGFLSNVLKRGPILYIHLS